MSMVCLHVDMPENTASSQPFSLRDYLNIYDTENPLLDTFEYLYIHEQAFTDGNLLDNHDISFIHYHTDLTAPVLDAVTLGILREQANPDSDRNNPTATHFTTIRGFTDPQAVPDAQPYDDIKAFLTYMLDNFDKYVNGTADTPKVIRNNHDISHVLRAAVLFGSKWEAWLAEHKPAPNPFATLEPNN